MAELDSAKLELHNSLYGGAVELLEPFLIRHVETGEVLLARSLDEQAALERACGLFDRAIRLFPTNWNAMWSLAMAQRFLGDNDGAYRSLKSAYAIAANEIEVGRNFAGVCIELGRAEEAVDVSRAVMNLSPSDAGLISNHALALLIDGRIDAASSEVSRALDISPADPVTMSLRNLLEAVRAGRIPRPAKWPP